MGLKQRVKYYPRMVDDVTLNCCSRAKNLFYFFFFYCKHIVLAVQFRHFVCLDKSASCIVAPKRNEMKYKYRQNQKAYSLTSHCLSITYCISEMYSTSRSLQE